MIYYMIKLEKILMMSLVIDVVAGTVISLARVYDMDVAMPRLVAYCL